MNALDNFLRHDRIVVVSSLAGVITIAWVYLLLGAGIEMDEMDMGGGQIMLMAPPWTPRYAVLIFLMWSIMMVAMMLPSAAPTILLVSALARNRGIGHGAQAAGLFTLGYVMTWVGFSLVAALLQWGLDSAGVLSDAMASKQRRGCRLCADCRRRLPVDAIETSLPAALPLAAGVPAAPLAQRRLGRRDERHASRLLLPRLLLDADGAAVHRRIDEPAVDWRRLPSSCSSRRRFRGADARAA